MQGKAKRFGGAVAIIGVMGAMCLAAGVYLAGFAWCATLQPVSAERVQAGSPDAASADQPSELLLREGTQLTNQLGSFRPVGDRIAFVTSDGKRRLVVLENLNLERVAQLIGEAPTPLVWSVTGTVTEYRGGNYLLVDRAVVSSGERPVKTPGP